MLIQPTGEIQSVSLVGSSSHDVLDQAALEAVRGLRPGPIPLDLPRRPIRVELPIVFDFR
jgi:TonB family protein